MHDACAIPIELKVQVVAGNVPVPLLLNSTVPVGGMPGPIPVESATVTVHCVAWLVVTVEGAHTTDVDVARGFTIMELLAPLLPEWTVSPG